MTSYRPSPLHDVSIVRSSIPGVHATYTRSGRRFGKHWHDVYGFGVLDRGAQSSASGRGQVCAYAGQVISTNPGEVHDGRPLGADTREWRIVSLDPDTMASLVGLASGGFEIAQPVIDDPSLAQAVEHLFDTIESHDSLAEEAALTRACTLLIARHGSTRIPISVPATSMSRVRDRLADDSRAAPTLAELAEIAGMSRYQLLRRFGKEFGLPPHAWLLRYRAARARRLIRAGRSLADSAFIAGFADQSHMTRVFVRDFGYTPGAWKRAFVAK